jgi:hypothetical protein
MWRGPLALLLNVVSCAGAVSSSTSERDAARTDPTPIPAPISDAAAAPLPPCSWPASLKAQVPDGAIRGWAVARAELACGRSVLDGGPWGAIGLSDSGTSLGVNAIITGDTLCLMGCEPNQYAVAEGNWWGVPPPDAAAIIRPVLPASCGGTRSVFTKVEESVATAEPLPTVYCCPCEQTGGP